jgi:hypothetical protein
MRATITIEDSEGTRTVHLTHDDLLAARNAYALAHNSSVRVADARRGDLCALRKLLSKLDDLRSDLPALQKVLGLSE